MKTAERTWWGPVQGRRGRRARRPRPRHPCRISHPTRSARRRPCGGSTRARRNACAGSGSIGPRREFALCRAALRANLCHLLDCTNERLSFGFGEHGKPFALVAGREGFDELQPQPQHRTWTEFAFAARGRLRKRIGVDAEVRRPDRDFDGIGERGCSGWRNERPCAAARGVDKVRLFYRLWALKEALIKALGTGFSLNPSRFEVPPA